MPQTPSLQLERGIRVTGERRGKDGMAYREWAEADGRGLSADPWSPTAMKVAAVCSLLSAVTTILLTVLPTFYSAPTSFEARVHLIEDSYFKTRAWTYYLHPFVCFVAGVGVWRIARSYERGLALFGIIGLGIWAYTEALQQALTNVAAGWNWFPAYAQADAAGRTLIEERWTMFFGLWDGLYFLLLTGFLLANTAFGIALIQAKKADRVVGACLLVVAALTLLNFFAGYGGPAWTGAVTGALYPYFQPALRAAIGIWLWHRRWVQ